MAANDRPALSDADRFTYSYGTSRKVRFPNAFDFANRGTQGEDKRPMEFGLFSNNRRPDRPIGEAWNEDIFEAEVADRLGFHEIWFSEHQSPAELIICKAAGRTQRIRLGSAVRPLGYYHPLQVALEANTTDQLTGGRYMLGIGTGFYPKKLEWRGLDPNSMRAVMEPSIELMLKLWNSKEPVDYDGPFWKGKKMMLECPPVQKPHPPVGIAAANTVASVELAGRLGLMVLTGDFIPTRWSRRRPRRAVNRAAVICAPAG
jgi:alkanesulfonate monooxygenase SsuD/methylene tetrahydromethanopterin reductase-like flavin-dependent oxidoreductase (luciferase family)